jgi:lysophospholipase L1-like esterase
MMPKIKTKISKLAIAAVTSVALVACGGSPSQNAEFIAPTVCDIGPTQNWVGAWANAPSLAEVEHTDQTLRIIISARFFGDTSRIQLSNKFGTQPVTFSSAFIGKHAGDGALELGSNQRLSFDCADSVTLAAGEERLSDPLAFSFDTFDELAVSLHVQGESGGSNEHRRGLQTSYIAPAEAGDVAAAEDGSAFDTTTTGSFFVNRIDVVAADNVGAIVAFGDSFTDGIVTTGGTTLTPDPAIIDQNLRYTDMLTRRLIAAGLGSRFSVLNTGIGGNRLVSDAMPGFPAFGQSGLNRLAADVLDMPGVTDVILELGGNDLGLAPPATSAEVIAGLTSAIASFQAANLNVILVTQLPCSGVVTPGGHGTPSAVAFRNEINEWSRNSSQADVILDWHPVVADPTDPDSLAPEFDSGDNLHPNVAGYQALTDVIDLEAFRGR